MTTKLQTERVYVCRRKLILDGQIRVFKKNLEKVMKFCKRECDGFDDDCPKYQPQIEGGYYIIR